MLIFILSSTLIVILLGEKLYLYLLEPVYRASIFGNINIVGLALLFLVGILSYFAEKARNRPVENHRLRIPKINLKNFIIITLILSVVLYTFSLNVSKKALDWDAVALYDARALFLNNGVRFSEMSIFSDYDEINYYYLLYPPYTSIAHYFWESSNIELPVSVYYSLILLLFAVILFLFSKRYLSLGFSLLVTFLVVANKDIFSISIIEYTNLPYSLHIFLGTMFLFSYIKTKRIWEFCFSIIFLSTSLWIRFLEPVWLLIIFSYMVAVMSKRKILVGIRDGVILLIFCLVEYLAWNNFTHEVAQNYQVLTISLNKIVDMFWGLFNGQIIQVSSLLFKWWGIALAGYATLIVAGLLSKRYLIKDAQMLFLYYIILFSIPFYTLALYFSSFQGEWWKQLGGSIIRSSTFLVPIGVFLLFMLFRKYRERDHKHAE